MAGGLAALWKCADWLVTGSVAIAERFGISPVVIGLTLVAMGTSAPEVAASIAAALEGAGDIAIGNVYGSNIANLALVGGTCALIRPITVQKRILCREIPVMIITALLLFGVLQNLQLSRPEALGLLAIFAGLLAFTVHAAKKEAMEKPQQAAEIEKSVKKSEKLVTRPLGISVVFVLIGLVGVALGAKMALVGAVFLGRAAGLSEAVIGQTIIAIGTSLPELVTSLVAVLKGQDDISVGNLVGSNIFNTLLVTGGAGTVLPFAVGRRLLGTDYCVMLAVSIGFAALAILGRGRIKRSSGMILLAGYVCYVIYLLAYSAG